MRDSRSVEKDPDKNGIINLRQWSLVLNGGNKSVVAAVLRLFAHDNFNIPYVRPEKELIYLQN